MMIIENRVKGLVSFATMPSGSVFENEGEIYIKVNNPTKDHNAIWAENCDLVFFPEGELVRPIPKAKLYLED